MFQKQWLPFSSLRVRGTGLKCFLDFISNIPFRTLFRISFSVPFSIRFSTPFDIALHIPDMISLMTPSSIRSSRIFRTSFSETLCLVLDLIPFFMIYVDAFVMV